jgi:hypothetical protein
MALSQGMWPPETYKIFNTSGKPCVFWELLVIVWLTFQLRLLAALHSTASCLLANSSGHVGRFTFGCILPFHK